MPSTSSPGRQYQQPCPFIEKLPNDLFYLLVSYLDSHSIRNLLRAFVSLGYRVSVILGPHHQGNGAPLFFTGFPCGVFHCTTNNAHDDGLLPPTYSTVNLYEINTGSEYFERFITREMKCLKSMSFIHFLTGDISIMGETSILKTLNSMHPFAPRISIEYMASGSDISQVGTPTEFITDKFDRDCITPEPESIILTEIPRYLRCSEYTNISIDCHSFHTVENLSWIENFSWTQIKQLEIVFYKADSIPVIHNLDLPNVLSFRVKYYQKTPLISRCKIGYASMGHSVFELLDTSAFDVHYEPTVDTTMRWKTYENVMDLSFTKNFHSLVFVGASCLIVFKLCDFSKATLLFWYENMGVYVSDYLDGLSDASIHEVDHLLDRQQILIRRLKTFIYAKNHTDVDGIPSMLTLPELEEVGIYTRKSASYLNLNPILGNGFTWRGLKEGHYYTKFSLIDICCDLPLKDIGSDEHTVIERGSMYVILSSKELNFVRIRGCYIGTENSSLLHNYLPRTITSNVVYESKPPLVSDHVTLELELVRRIESEVDQLESPKVTLLHILQHLRYLTSVKITQVLGGEKYKPWGDLVVEFPGRLLTDGLVVKIDSSFGVPKLTYVMDEIRYEMSTLIHLEDVPVCNSYNANALRMWTTSKGGTNDGKPWSMIPSGFTF